MARTNSKDDTHMTRGDSRPVRWELIDKHGQAHGPFPSAMEAASYAVRRWPDQEQDEYRTGKGWDIQAVGS